jgi:hypothetical protein
MNDPFETAEPLSDDITSESKKEKPKYFVIKEALFVANSPRELREYLEESDPEGIRIIRGSETILKKKTIYTF